MTTAVRPPRSMVTGARRGIGRQGGAGHAFAARRRRAGQAAGPGGYGGPVAVVPTSLCGVSAVAERRRLVVDDILYLLPGEAQ